MMISMQRLARQLRQVRADVDRPQIPTTADARAQRHFDKLVKKDPIAALLKKEGIT